MTTNHFEAFDALEPPETFVITTYPEASGVIEERGQEWFAAVRRSLGLESLRFNSSFQTRIYSTNEGPGYPDVADVEMMAFRFEGQQTLASVFDERNNGNAHMVSFLKHPLHDLVRRDIESFHENIPKPW
jgi:hypothetical protein